MIFKELSRSEIEAKIQDGVSLLYFYSHNCGPCVLVDKLMDQISSLENIAIYKVNSEQETKWVRELKVDQIPMTFLVKDGQIINKIIGLTTRSDYFDLIKKFV